MLKRLLRVAAVVPLVALAFGASVPRDVDAQGAVGSSPTNAENFGIRNVTKVALLKAGERRWFVATTSTNTTRVAATLQTNPYLDARGTRLLRGENDIEPGIIHVYVNLRGANAPGSNPSGLGQDNKDAPGLVRVGHLTPTQNSGPDRVYHFMRHNEILDTFYLLENNSRTDVVYAFTVDHSFCLGCTGREGGSENPKDWGLLPPPFAFES